VPAVKLFALLHRTVSTPFSYLPRTRPPMPIPVPLVATASDSGFVEMPQWKSFSSTIAANRRGIRDLVAKVRLSAHLSPKRNIVLLAVHPYYANILHSPAHSVPRILPFRHRFLTCLFATLSCDSSNRSEETSHTDSTHATDNGRRSVSHCQWSDGIPPS